MTAAPPPGPLDRVFDALDNPIAVLDAYGCIVAVNDAWTRASQVGGGDPAKTGVGADYLGTCDAATGARAAEGAPVAAGIRAVLAGRETLFVAEYPCPSPTEDRWFQVRVSPLPEGGAVVIHHEITALRAAELRVRDDDVRVLRALDESSQVFVLLEADGSVSYVSEQTSELVGWPREELVGARAFGFVAPADRDTTWETFARTAAVPGGRASITCRLAGADGRWHHVELTVVNLLDDPDVRSIVATGVDVSESRLRQIASRLEGPLLQRLPAAVVVVDESGAIVYWNQRAETMFGVSRDVAVGRRLDGLGIRALDPAADGEIGRRVRAAGRWEGDYEVILPTGEVLPTHTLVEWLDDDDIDFHGTIMAVVDVTERRRLEEELAFQALHDPLTGLPNRRSFIARMDALLAAEASAGRLAVAFIDVDDFKIINDRDGHSTGDAVLRVIGDRITSALRERDVVARMGGDEFVVGLIPVETAEEAAAIGARLLAAVRAPIVVDGQRLQVSATVGIARWQEGVGAEQLLRNADAAMYLAKEEGKDRVELFDDELREQTRSRREFAERLRAAVDAGRIHAHFQPQTCLRTGGLVGFEALARWEGDDPAFEGSAAFLAMAAESGVVIEIDQRILEETCEALARFHRERPELGCTISTNVSAALLADPGFAPLVRTMVTRAGFPPPLLCIEVVESALLDSDAVAETLDDLEAFGVEVAIDDFGTGYSSMSRLQQFHVDYLKIDQSFVAGVGTEDRYDAVVSAIVGLGRAMGLRTIAEGVEREDQVQLLASLGVDIGQGFRWSAARPFDEALAMLRDAEATGNPCWSPGALGAPSARR